MHFQVLTLGAKRIVYSILLTEMFLDVGNKLRIQYYAL
jgi:hypothetical protein